MGQFTNMRSTGAFFLLRNSSQPDCVALSKWVDGQVYHAILPKSKLIDWAEVVTFTGDNLSKWFPAFIGYFQSYSIRTFEIDFSSDENYVVDDMDIARVVDQHHLTWTNMSNPNECRLQPWELFFVARCLQQCENLENFMFVLTQTSSQQKTRFRHRRRKTFFSKISSNSLIVFCSFFN